MRERHRIDAAAHGNREPRVAIERRDEAREIVAVREPTDVSASSLSALVLATAAGGAVRAARAPRARASRATSSCAALAVRLPPGARDLHAEPSPPSTAAATSVRCSIAPPLFAPAQSQRRRFGEARSRDRVVGVRPREQAELRERPALLAVPRADRHVDHARFHAQAIGRHARFPRRSCRRRRTRARPRRRHRARFVGRVRSSTSARTMFGSPGQRARSRAAAGAEQTARLAARAALRRGHEMAQDRGAGRRHAFAARCRRRATGSPPAAGSSPAPAPAAVRARCARCRRPSGSDDAVQRAPVELRPRCIRPRRRRAANPNPRARGNARRRRECRARCASASASSASSASACSRVGADSGASVEPAAKRRHTWCPQARRARCADRADRGRSAGAIDGV